MCGSIDAPRTVSEHLPLPYDGSHHQSHLTRGALAAFTSYFLWGILPVYWKALGHVSLLELMAHRAWWTLVAVTLFLVSRREFASLMTAWKSAAIRRAHLMGCLLLMGNWGFYILGVSTNRILETSLGYFLVPLLNAALGSIVFREKLRRALKIALCFATIGVIIMVWQIGKTPWIALGIAGTWSAYGLIHKRSPTGALTGLAIETTFAAPFALGFIVWLGLNSQPRFGGGDHSTTLLMIGTGVISMVPLTLFALGARRLRFTTLGLLQYVAPSCQFLIGWLIYHEPLSAERTSAFALIWIGLAIYTFDSIKGQRR